MIFNFLSSALLIASVATASSVAVNNESNTGRALQATLAEKWNITDPTFDYDSLSFDLDYGISDWIMEGMVSHSIWDENCKEGGTSVASDILASSQTTLPNTRGDGLGRRVQQVTVAVNPEKITSDPNIYEETVVNGEQFAIVTFCVRFNLSTGGSSSIEVNFHETLITLNVDLTDGFAIDDIEVAPRDRLVTTANQAYEVEGYQCDRNYVELNEAQKATTRNQGAIIRVCVRPTQEGRDDGIYMREIQSFTFSRATPPATQVAIENSAAANNGLTDLFCDRGWEVCAFETILFAAFYRESGSVAGSGIASMQFGGSGRRLRALQANDQEAAVAEFEIEFVTLRTLENLSSGASSTAGFLFTAVSALFGFIALVL